MELNNWSLIHGKCVICSLSIEEKVINICGASLVTIVIVLGSVLKLMSFGKSDTSVKTVYEYYFNAEFLMNILVV